MATHSSWRAAGFFGCVAALLILSQCAPTPADVRLAGVADPTPSHSATEIAPPSPAYRYAYVSADVLNCRLGPSTGDNVVAKLTRGSGVTVHKTNEMWSQVRTVVGVECWVAEAYLVSDLESAMAAATPIPRAKLRSNDTANGYHSAGSGSRSSAGRARSSSGSSSRTRSYSYGGSCPCSGSQVCIGPRGGRYCITSGGNKRYGV